MMRRRNPEDEPVGHPSQEHREMHPTDMKLRKHGYRIEGRPKGEPTWRLGEKVYTQSEALVRIAECSGR